MSVTVMELFITHIEAECQLLKIWAQVDRAQAVFVERLILQITQHFNKEDALVDPLSLKVGELCCAKYTDKDHKSAYYRARIINLDHLSENMVTVQFIDYGNHQHVQISDIKSLHSLQTPLNSLRGQATEFYLAGVISKLPEWEEASLEKIREYLLYEEAQGVLKAQVENKKFLTVYYEHRDFVDYITSEGIGIPIELTSQLQLLNCSASPFHSSLNIPCVRLMAPPKPQTMKYFSTRSPVSNPRFQQSRHLLEEKTFATQILDINTEHMVYVSYVEDGPWSFYVHLQAMEGTLSELMAQLNAYPPTPVRRPIMPGFVCLGRDSGDQSLCRAMVSSVMGDECVLYYVDYGNSETKLCSEIYDLSPKYMKFPAMALRFTLSGLAGLPKNDIIKEYFGEIVSERALVLKVVTPDEPPTRQYCELMHNKQNLLQVLLEKTKPMEYKPLLLSIGATEKAVVSYLVNPSHFYIQLSCHVSELNAIMKAVETHSKNSAPPLSFESLQVGLPCCAFSARDGKWYRAQVISVLTEAVNVKYVDYGKSDTVSLSSLRNIEHNLVSVLHMQAVKCCLNGFQDMKSDLLSTKFEELIRFSPTKSLKLNVLGKVEDSFIVELYNTSAGIEFNVGELLLEMKDELEMSTPQPVQHERYEAPASMIQEIDGRYGAAAFQNISEEAVSISNKNYESYAPEKERFNRRSSRNGNDDDSRDSWKSRKEDRFWRNKDERNGNWKDNHDRGRRGKERFGEEIWGDEEKEIEQKPWQEDIGEQEEFKKKPWARDEDGRRYKAGGYPRNAEDGERFQKRRGDGRRQNADNVEGRFYGRRDDNRPKKFNNKDSRRRDPDYKWKNLDDDSFNTSRVDTRVLTCKDYTFTEQSLTGSGLINQAEEDWDNTTTEEDWDNTTTPSVTIKPLQAEEDWGNTTSSATIKPPSINIGDVKTVEVVFCKNPEDFYVQATGSSEFSTLMDTINTTYKSAGAINAESLKKGSVCIARYANSKTWYRAVVESVSADSAVVFFSDYGNKDTVSLTDIKEIENELLDLPAQGVPCSLLAVKPKDLSWSVSEVHSFISAVERKTLKAKFVSQNSGRFNVILNDPQSNSDINLQFGATPEQLKATSAVKKSEYNTFSAQTQQIIKSNQRFLCQSFIPDAVEQVLVTWFIDPEEFYCQLKSSQAVMNEMMLSIQDAYTSKSPTFRPIEVGLPVIAKFSADNALYRAEVKIIEDPVSVTVQFIDYGNSEKVMNTCVFDMEERFMNLPKQAVRCTLKGVKPANEKWCLRDTMKYFETEFQCTFHRFIEEKFEVSLVHNGMNVASELIEAGVAVPAREEILETAVEGNSDEEPVELSLLPGQMLKVHVTFVESSTKFFVQLNPAFAQEIQTMVDQHARNPKNLQCMNPERISVGDFCLASSDLAQWYRAKIVDCTQTTGVLVTFIDVGDGDEVPFNKVMVSPSSVQYQPAQAIECTLYRLSHASTPEAEYKFKCDVENQDVIMKVEGVKGERLYVTIYDQDGEKLEILSSTEAESLLESSLCPLPVLSRKMRVWVSHVNNANSLWLQRVSDSEILSELLDKLHNIYEEEGKGSRMYAHVGDLCAARSDSFNAWYRAKIISKNPEEGTCDVLFIDYGNTETVPIATNIRTLDASLSCPHELAVHISLPLITSEDLTSQLQEMTADKEFIAVFSKMNDKIWLADLFEGNMSLSKKLIELNLATCLPGMEVANQIIESNIEFVSELCASLEVLVSHFDSPGQFWLQLASNNDAILEFQENLQITAERLPAVNVQVGLHCIAQFPEDNLWYRAVVLDINSSYITVRYTDYGNSSQLELTAEGIKELPEELCRIPYFAFPCCINASPIDGSYWNAEAVARCEELLNQETTITINEVAKEEVKVVDVFVGGVSVVDVLLKENLAVPRKSPVIECSLSTVPEVVNVSSKTEHVDSEHSGDTDTLSSANVVTDDDAQVHEKELQITVENEVHSGLREQCEENLAVVSYAESLEEFWLQYRSIADQVHQLEYRLLEAESFPPLKDIIEGKLCAAVFDDDNQWYRAKILGKMDHGTQVEFIDYGNISISDDVRKLPADLVSLPPMAQRCSLALPETVTEWPPDAKDKFLDLVHDGCKWFEVKIIEQGDPAIVSLTYDGKQIQTEICKDVIETSASTGNLSKTEHSEESKYPIIYVINEAYYKQQIRRSESFENEIEVPEDKETVFTDGIQKIKESNDNDKCEINTSDKVDDTDVTTVVNMINHGHEHVSQDEATYNDEHVSHLTETSSAGDKDESEEPETETSGLNVVKESCELLTAEENLMDENDTEIEKDGILVAEGKQCIGANDCIAPIIDSEMDAITADGNVVTEGKPKGTKESPEKESDPEHEVIALNMPDTPKRHSLPGEEAEHDDSRICNNLKSSECKIDHTEELIMKINVEMLVNDKAAKKSQIDMNTFVSTSKEPTSTSISVHQSDETPEELPRSQSENETTKSEPCTPLLSRARSSVKDEKQIRSSSNPRFSHSKKIVHEQISRSESDE